jgi:hypothetical protein
MDRPRLTAVDARNLAILLLGVLLLWIPRLRGPIDLRWDAGVYYVLGTSLAEGRGYRLLNEPGEIEGVQYPPGLPAIVAIVQKATGTSDTVRAGHALRLLFFIVSLAYAAATYVLARQFLLPSLSLLAAAATCLHHYTVYLADICYAEVPFGLVAVLFALALRFRAGVVAAVLAATAFLLRTSGIALLAAWVIEALLRRRPRQASVRAALSLVLVLLWQSHVARVTRSPEYQNPSYAYQRAPYLFYNVPYADNLKLLDPYHPEGGRLSTAGLVRRVLGNLVRTPFRLGDAVSVAPRNWAHIAWRVALRVVGRPLPWQLEPVPRLILGLAVLSGLVGLARLGEWFIPLFVAGSVAVVSVTPWPDQLSRYLSPLTPFLAVAFAAAVGWMWERRVRFAPLRWVIPLVVSVVLVMQVDALVVLYTKDLQVAEQVDRNGTRARGRVFYYGSAARSLDASLDWLGAHADRAAVVATSAPQVAFLRTGLKAVMPPLVADVSEAQRLLDSVPVTYLVAEDAGEYDVIDVGRRYGEPAVRAHPDLWELVHDGGARIYRRRAPQPGP